MVQSKKMDESAFASLIEKATSIGELIRSKQDQKQVVIDDFEKTRDRYKNGKISETALASSVRITNNQLIKLDKTIRETIQRHNRLADNAKSMASRQSPKVFRAHLYGVKGTKKRGSSKKKGSSKSKSVKRTPNPGIARILSEERKLDKKYQR